MSLVMVDFSSRRTMMVDTQIRPSDVTKFPVIEAMLDVAREAYVPDDKREAAYVGENIALGNGRVILEPRTLAKMLDALDVQPNDLVLDIGSAYGYSAAIVAQLAEAVVAVEEDEDMATESQSLLSANGADNAAVVAGRLSEGAAKHGPYDAIILEGGVEAVPDALIAQLKDGGRIVALFMEDALGVVRIGHKRVGHMDWRFSFNASAPVMQGFEKASDFAL